MTPDQISNILNLALKVSLLIFMVGNLVEMGIKLKLQEALSGLRNVRFLMYSILWGFILCPALAWGLTKLLPLSQPYAIGMMLLGMTPCAPFLPSMVQKARGDLGYTAAFMLLASVVTVAFMPLAVPLLVKGVTADAWTIAKPLLYFVLLPLAVGMAIKGVWAEAAGKMVPFIRKTTDIDTLLMLVLCVAIYYKGFALAVGTYAFGTQILFFSIAITASYALSFGLTREQRSVISLGMSTRNIGAAMAPLFALSSVDQRALVMVVIAVPMQMIFSLLAARWFARRASTGGPAAPRGGVSA